MGLEVQNDTPRQIRLRSSVIQGLVSEAFALGVERLQGYTKSLPIQDLVDFQNTNPTLFDLWALINAHGTSIAQGITLPNLIYIISGGKIDDRVNLALSSVGHVFAEYVALSFRDEIRVIDPKDIGIAIATSAVTLLANRLIQRRNEIRYE